MFTINDLAYLTQMPTDFVAELDGSNNYLYVGAGIPGAKTEEPRWQIKKFLISSSDNATPIEGRFADADPGFNKVWDDRATYDYAGL